MKRSIALLALILTATSSAALAADDSEQVEVDAIKNKYWARGDESQVGVVQNRIYTKAKRFSVGVMGGTLISDPFLSTSTLGFNLGYATSETFGFAVVGFRSFAKASSALEQFEEFSHGGTANTNLPRWYIGGEAMASLMYGKLSLLGASIIHYDMHLSAGVGMTLTENGDYLTPSIGLGQRFYISKRASIRLDYRLMLYREEILEKVVPQKLGDSRGFRINMTNSVTIGFDFMFGGPAETGPAGGEKK